MLGGVLSNLMHRREVEDTAVGIIRTESGITGIIESGFNYPSGTRAGDHFFRSSAARRRCSSATATMASR